MKTLLAATFAVLALSVGAARIAAQQAPAKPSLTGAWTLNKDLSDKPPERGDRDGDSRGQGRRGGGGGGYGRRGGGGGGGGFGGRGGYGGGMGRGGGAAMDPKEMERMRDAMRDVMQAADRLTIVETESMIVLTSSDGRTTRLSPDGKKIKDENTNVERRTKWDGGKLVSEIAGLGRGKITQTYSVDPDSHQLRIVTQMEGGRDNAPPRTITHVYDADTR
jgi:hypothetical protein